MMEFLVVKKHEHETPNRHTSKFLWYTERICPKEPSLKHNNFSKFLSAKTFHWGNGLDSALLIALIVFLRFTCWVFKRVVLILVCFAKSYGLNKKGLRQMDNNLKKKKTFGFSFSIWRRLNIFQPLDFSSGRM